MRKNTSMLKEQVEIRIPSVATSGCFDFLKICSGLTGNRFGWKFQKAYGAAPSDSLLWHLTAHRDQRLLSNKLSGPKTWHRHLVSCWQRFAAPAPAVSQSPYWGSVSKFYSQHRLLFWISTPQILYSLLDSSPTVRCSHRYGKPWMVLSQLHHCSHSACFHVCTISQQTVPTLVFDVPGTGKLLFIQLEWKRTWNMQTWNAKHERRFSQTLWKEYDTSKTKWCNTSWDFFFLQ